MAWFACVRKIFWEFDNVYTLNLSYSTETVQSKSISDLRLNIPLGIPSSWRMWTVVPNSFLGALDRLQSIINRIIPFVYSVKLRGYVCSFVHAFLKFLFADHIKFTVFIYLCKINQTRSLSLLIERVQLSR